MNNVQRNLTGIVVFDPDDCIARAYKSELKYRGYQTKVFNTACFCSSAGYNPFIYAQSDIGITKFVSAFISGTEGYNAPTDVKFASAETALLSAIFSYIANYAPKNEHNFSTVHEALKYMHSLGDDNDSAEFLLGLLRKTKPNSLAIRRYNDFQNTTGIRINSILESCMNRLLPFSTVRMDAYMLNDELDLHLFGRDNAHKTVIIISAGKSPPFDFLAEILHTQIIDTLCFETANK